MSAELYIAMVLKEKGASVRTMPLHIGEFLYDHRGDLIGFYVGPNQIMQYNDLLNANMKVLAKVSGEDIE